MSDGKDNPPSMADQVGQAAGGITGVIAGAAIGATAGPIGSLLGGLAGAIGGWWSGRAIVEAAEDIGEADEQFYRTDFESRESATNSYDQARRAYYLGDVATANPDYSDRPFDDVEPELARGWSADGSYCEWPAVRDYASIGFARGLERRRRRRDQLTNP
ncbi:MAG: hypothetical protein ACRENU_06095 [Gemmatimonadaceae bacterium]